MDYAGRAVLVTGASSGIGREIALDLAGRGAQLSLIARRADRLEEVAAACRAAGGRAHIQVGDLAERAFVDRVVPEATRALGRLDILINNAGIPKHKQVYDLTPEDVERTLAVNFTSAALLTLAAIPVMLRQGEGYVVNISSIAGRIAPPREATYAASKFALTGWSEGMALDLAGSNIHTAAIHVGPVDTEIWEKLESPARFAGSKASAADVARAVRRAIEERRYDVTVPGRFAWLMPLKGILPSAIRRGAGRWDPVPEDVVTAARERATAAPDRGEG